MGTLAMLVEKLEGAAGADSIEVTEKGTRLPDVPARLVKLENWHVGEDLVTDNVVQVLWGYRGSYAHWLRAGGNSELLPVSNLREISLRTKPGEAVRVYFSWYR